MLGVCDPRPHPPDDFFFGNGPVTPAVAQSAQPVAKAAHIVLGQAAAPIGEQHETEEGCGFTRGQDECLARMQAEPPPIQ